MNTRKPLLLAALLLAPAPWAPSHAEPAEPAPAAAVSPPPGTLRFEIEEGRLLNAFLRQDQTAAHLLLRSGAQPRLIVAFPAGNSGVGLWFEPAGAEVHWRLGGPLQALHERDARGRDLHGIAADIEVDAARLVVRDTVLGNIRVLRDFEFSGTQPDAVRTQPGLSARAVEWARDRLDGAPGYTLAIDVVDGQATTDRTGHVVFEAVPGRTLRLRVRALTGEAALTPLTTGQLLGEAAGDDERSRQVLAFLAYQEKLLAGSWRFNTYFGRDSLMSVRLLMPALQPPAVEAGLGSVLARLSPGGEVAHEEDIGEFAILRHLKEGSTASDTPIHDYAMIDDDFMLAPVAAAWLLDDPRGHARAAAFLAARAANGERHGDALVRNLAFVEERTRAFGAAPVVAHLVGLKDGRNAGQWRDSDEGLGRGRYPYDVNVVFVPAALRAADALVGSGLLDPYLTATQRVRFAGAAQRAVAWERQATALYEVEVSPKDAATQVRAYAAHLGVPATPALRALGEHPLAFPAVSLDAHGQPVPVLHSDDGFRLLFGRPAPGELSRAVGAMTRPFPAGLMTDAGMLVANPVFAGAEAWRHLDASAYHGTVVWSWQQALWAAGLDRQLARRDLPAGVRADLAQARVRLWCAIENSRSLRTSELWSWSFRDGRYRAEPFGARGSDEDESNAAQLWSTVFLAVPQPVTNESNPCPSAGTAGETTR